MTLRVPAKLQVVNHLLGRTPSVFLHCDGRVVGLQLPAHLLGTPLVVLQIGHDMPVPIPDLKLDDRGVTATLHFRGGFFPCVIPWDAVKVACGSDGRGVVFDYPWFHEASAAIEAVGLTGNPDVPRHPSERPWLRRVK